MKTYTELKSLIEQRGVHTVFGAPGEGWAIEQNADELAQFLVICQEQGVQSVLEIGTGYKGGLSRFLAAEMGWEVTTVDIEDYGHSFAGVKYDFADTAELPHFLKSFDLVIIDAEHTYEATHFNHDYYGKYAAKIIMFHDIAGLRECEGVRDYWYEIAYPDEDYLGVPLLSGYHEIIADTDQRGGIGYMVMSEVQAEPVPMTKGMTITHIDDEGKRTVTASIPPEPAKTVPAKPAPLKRTPAKKTVAGKTAAKK